MVRIQKIFDKMSFEVTLSLRDCLAQTTQTAQHAADKDTTNLESIPPPESTISLKHMVRYLYPGCFIHRNKSKFSYLHKDVSSNMITK